MSPCRSRPAPGPDDVTHHRAAARRLVELVELLPPNQREAFLLQAEGGLSLEEIAEATGGDFEAVKSRLRYARNKLKTLLADFAEVSA